jgi:hypothetical protein
MTRDRSCAEQPNQVRERATVCPRSLVETLTYRARRVWMLLLQKDRMDRLFVKQDDRGSRFFQAAVIPPDGTVAD